MAEGHSCKTAGRGLSSGSSWVGLLRLGVCRFFWRLSLFLLLYQTDRSSK